MTALFAHLILIGAPAALLFLALSRLGPRRPPYVDLLLAVSVPCILGVACVLWTRSEAIVVTIDGLNTEKQISKAWLTIEGTVSPEDARVFLLVRPVTADTWWVQSPPRKAPSGAWRCEVNFGTSEYGKSDDYLVIAVATKMPQAFAFLSQTQLTESSKVQHLPSLPCSKVHVVRRRP